MFDDWTQLEYFLAILSVVFGGMIGSFLNVCIHRLPREESIVKPRSKCPKCGYMIPWYDNIPVLSWLVLRARCRKCRAPISFRYPAVELLTALLFLAVYLRFGNTIASPVYMALSAGLIVVTFVDLDDWTIPNEITFPGIPIGIACAVFAMFVPGSGLLVDNVFDAMLGVIAGGGILYAMDKVALLLLKKRGMGFGDVKLLAMLGAFFGWQGVILMVVVSSFAGSIIGVLLILMHRAPDDEEVREGAEGGHYLPFGPYIVLAGFVMMFAGPQLIDIYLNYIGLHDPVALR